MNSSRNSSGGRHQGKKKPQKSSTNKFESKRKFSDSSKSKPFKKASDSDDDKRPQRFEKKRFENPSFIPLFFQKASYLVGHCLSLENITLTSDVVLLQQIGAISGCQK